MKLHLPNLARGRGANHAPPRRNAASGAAGAVWIRRLAGAVCLVVGLGLIAGCSKPAAPDPTLLAKVGAREIRVADLQQEIGWRLKNHRPLPDAKALLEELISREVLLQKARAAGLEQDPNVTRAYQAMLVGKFKERELAPRVDAASVSIQEVRAEYERQLNQYVRPAKARLAIIYIQSDSQMSAERAAELRARIAQARQQALTLPKDSRGFGQVAVNFSEDPATRFKGGDIGWFDQGRSNYRWPDDVIAAGFALPSAGAVSDVIQAGNGFYLVMKLDARAAETTPLEQAEEGLRRRLLAQKRQQLEQSFAVEMGRGVPVRTFPSALAAVPVPAPDMARSAAAEPPMLP